VQLSSASGEDGKKEREKEEEKGTKEGEKDREGDMKYVNGSEHAAAKRQLLR